MRKRSGFLKVLGIAAALLIIAVVALPFFLNANQFRPQLEARLSGALGRRVKVGNLSLSILAGSVGADDITISDDPRFSRDPFVRARSLQVGVELRPLIFSREVRITGVTLKNPEITLIRTAGGDWNYSSLGGGSTADSKQAGKKAASAGSGISVAELRVIDGRVTLVRAGRKLKPVVYDRVNLTARNISASAAFPFNLTVALPGGGNLKLEGQAGPLGGTDLSRSPLEAALGLSHFDIAASGLLDPAAGIGGILDFTGTLASDGRRAESKGHATVEKLQIATGGAPAGRPVALEYGIDYDLERQTGSVSGTKVEIGKAVATLDGGYALRGDVLTADMKLRGEKMPAEDFEAMLPAIGVTLPRGASIQGGTLDVDLAAAGPVERMTTTGTVDLLNTRLDGFDLGGKIAAMASLAGIKSGPLTDIEKFASGIRLTPEGIQASGLTLIVPSLGKLTGSGTIAANQSLDFKMKAELNMSSGVTGELARLAGVKVDAFTIPFFVRGTTSDPRFVPDVKGMANGLLDSDKAKSTGGKIGDALRNLLGKKKPNKP